LLEPVGVDAGEFEGFEMVCRVVGEAVAGAVEGPAAMVVNIESLGRMRMQSGSLWAVHCAGQRGSLALLPSFYPSTELDSVYNSIIPRPDRGGPHNFFIDGCESPSWLPDGAHCDVGDPYFSEIFI
jgi:hypothetical protein